jgi:hypothetical protein
MSSFIGREQGVAIARMLFRELMSVSHEQVNVSHEHVNAIYISSMSKAIFSDRFGQCGGIFFDTSTYSSYMSLTYATWLVHVPTNVCTLLQLKWLQCV